MKMTQKIETITPELAATYFAANGRNRKLDKHRVHFFATMMRAKVFRLC